MAELALVSLTLMPQAPLLSQPGRRLNILLVAPWQPEPGNAGVQSSAGTLTEGLCKHHNVTILTPSYGSETTPTRIGDRVTVYRQRSPLPLKAGRLDLKATCNWLISLPGGIRRIRHICREQRIDVIHLYQLQMSHFPISLVRRLGGPPLVGTFHGRDAKEYHQRPAIGRWLVRQVVQQTSAFTAVSEDQARVAEKAIPGVRKVSVIRSGVSPIDRAVTAQENDFAKALPDRYFLSVGRLYPLSGPPVKGHDLTIRAWGILKQNHPDLHLVIIGKAAEEAAYRALAEDQHCAHLVHILGSHPRNDVLRAMHRSLGIITASRHEGGGPTMTVLEAGALSKPLIASDIPAYTECLSHGIDSLIVPKEDVAAIGSAVTRLLADPPFAQELGRALAHLVATRYSAEQTGERYASIYRAALATAAQA